MRVLITGIDGYLGWPLALSLGARGHVVGGIDNFSRRRLVESAGAQSAIPIASMCERRRAFRRVTGRELSFVEGELTDYETVAEVYRGFQPEAIVYLGEMPSAPFSMKDVASAVFTQTNNVIGTLVTVHAMYEAVPACHLLKLGSMGEYGTPDVDIPEGWFDVEYRGRQARMPFPRQAGSRYHQSKVHDSHNVEMACRLWKLRATDVMQGIVYGSRIPLMGDDPVLATRFDCDQVFGTAVNRFCAQAVAGVPMTPYGSGAQRRGFIALRDAIQCMTIAIEHPPARGEYRVFNQFESVHGIREIAQLVQAAAREVGLEPEVEPVDNPRIEMEDHRYEVERRHLAALGYEPESDLRRELLCVFADLLRHRDRLKPAELARRPSIRWDAHRD